MARILFGHTIFFLERYTASLQKYQLVCICMEQFRRAARSLDADTDIGGKTLMKSC